MSAFEIAQPLFEHIGEIIGELEKIKTILSVQRTAFVELMQIAAKITPAVPMKAAPTGGSLEVLQTPPSQEMLNANIILQKVLALCQEPHLQQDASAILKNIQQLLPTPSIPALEKKKKSTRKKSTLATPKTQEEANITQSVKKSTKKSKKSTKKSTTNAKSRDSHNIIG